MIRLITPLALLAALSIGPDSNAQQHRVKRIQREQYTSNNGIVKTDSAVLFYNGSNGGQPTWQWAENVSRGGHIALYNANPLLGYDSLVSKVNTENYPPWKKGIYGVSQKLNIAGQVTGYNRYYSSAQQGTPTVEQAETYTYNGSTLTESISGYDKLAYYYQNGVLVRTDLSLKSPGSSVLASYYYSYDPTGNLKQVMYAKASPMAVHDSTWKLFSYDSQNRLTEMMEINDAYNGLRDTFVVRQYSYDSNGDLVLEDGYGEPVLRPLSKLISTYNAQHNKTELILLYSTYPTFTVDTHQRIKFIYDNNNLLTKLETENWDNGQWAPHPDTSAASSSHTYTFEYEVAWPAGLPDVEDAANVKLYPSPASDFMRIETDWKNAQPFTAAILDIQGRIVRQWEEPATKNYARTIPLTELPSGMYVIKLSCGEEQYSKQFAIYK